MNGLNREQNDKYKDKFYQNYLLVPDNEKDQIIHSFAKRTWKLADNIMFSNKENPIQLTFLCYCPHCKQENRMPDQFDPLLDPIS